MTPLTLRLLCLCAALGAYLCSSGLLRLNEVFFQSSTASSSDWDAEISSLGGLQEADAAYDRLVIVLIDALRADMVLGSAAMHGHTEDTPQQMKGELNAHMPFTSGLVTSGRALGYVAHASVPTVTMPRLKALVTGKAPAFIDILKNFNSAALDEDANLVSLLAASGKRIVFYGDDTWLKLFPETFKRSDGTSGFYTRDTVEVDDNVTRHLSEELDPTMQNEKSGDWDALVLHYLGLDHVGHLRGPRSPLMRDKLQEMDGVVQRVVESVREQDAQRMESDDTARPSLILLCSDHGMSEVGNHGGATLEESSALLMFLRGDGESMHSSADISYEQKRSQVDLVPTISALFGLPIPLYSTGLLLADVVRASPQSASHHGSYYLRALYRNFQQLYALAKIKFHASALVRFDEQFEAPLSKLRYMLQGNGDAVAVDQETAAAVLKACEALQARVAQSDGSEYNAPAIFSGLLLLFFSGVIALVTLITNVKETARSDVENSDVHLLAVLGVGSALQIASLSSSSSIENEHATAFFMTTSLLVALGVVLLRRQKSSYKPSSTTSGLFTVGILLVLTRMLRARNQVINFWRLNGLHVDTNLPGNEFATDDSVSILSTAALFPSRLVPLNVCVALISVVVLRKAVQHSRKRSPFEIAVSVCGGLLFAAGMLASLRVKELAEQTELEEDKVFSWWGSLDADASARVVYASVVLLSFLTTLAGRRLRLSLVEMSIWLLVGLLQRDTNFPTLCVLCLQMEAVATLLRCKPAAEFRHNGVVMAGLALWLSQAAFFALGNSHLVTTIDISQSYHGLSSYSQGLVGALTFVSVFSGPLVCFVNLFQWLNTAPGTTAILSMSNSASSDARRTACLAIFTYQALRFAVYTVVVYLMRFHLFIWSVFAPKMLYEVAHLFVSLVLVLLLASPVSKRHNEKMNHEL